MTKVLAITNAQAAQLRSLIARRERGTGGPRVDQAGALIEFLVDSVELLDGSTTRWWYTLVESRIDPDTLLPAAVDGGLEVVALNREEDGNTDSVIAPGILIADLLPDWELYPVSYGAGGLRCHRSVVATFGFRTTEGDPVWRFSAVNVIDGPCPEPSSESGA